MHCKMPFMSLMCQGQSCVQGKLCIQHNKNTKFDPETTSQSASTVVRSDQGSRFIGKFRKHWDCLVLSDNQHLRMSSPYYAASAEDDLVSPDLLNSLSFLLLQTVICTTTTLCQSVVHQQRHCCWVSETVNLLKQH